jgi:hypothetical protein
VSGSSSSGSGGIGFFGLLAIVFITLKLTGFIHWSWVWVLAPLWFPIIVVLLILLAYLLIVGALAGSWWKIERDFKRVIRNQVKA